MEKDNLEQTLTLQQTANEWWNNLPATDRFRLLQENGYQDQKKPWKYRPLTDKGIYLIWSRQHLTPKQLKQT
jgi:hypothetical protein